jgi:hypothetical protein
LQENQGNAMGKDESRRPPQSPAIEPELVDEAVEQLDAEISLLEEWIAGLNNREDPDEAALQARTTYQDKLRSRREMRDALLISQKNRQ